MYMYMYMYIYVCMHMYVCIYMSQHTGHIFLKRKESSCICVNVHTYRDLFCAVKALFSQRQKQMPKNYVRISSSCMVV